MFNFLKNKIKKASSKFVKLKDALGSNIKALFSKGINNDSLEKLEKILYEADLGASLCLELTEKIKLETKKNKNLSSNDILNILKSDILKILTKPNLQITQKPFVIKVVGVNGSGKTTSIAKLANYYKNQNKKILLVAADTFRAAAVEQLDNWAKKLEIDIVKSQFNSDPSSVVFDALESAKKRDIDIVIIDTAGRLQTKTELMQELKKITKVCSKQIPNAPHVTYLTLDATIGQNALDQANIFNQFTPISGIILAKLDGSSKGGIVVAIEKNLKIPVVWTGVGEKVEDFIPFDPKVFAEELLAVES